MHDAWAMLLVLMSLLPAGTRQEPVDAKATLRVELGPHLCPRRPRVTIARADAARAVDIPYPACTTELRLAAPAAYTLKWTASDGSWDERSEDLPAGETRALVLEDTPYVTGKISLTHGSLANLAIAFGREGIPGPGEAATDIGDDGVYRVELPEPGTYTGQLSSRGLSLPGQNRDVTVRFGRNQLDWQLEGGVLTVDLQGWDRASDVVVRVSRVVLFLNGVISHGVRLGPPEPLPLTFSGVDPGSYEVFALQEKVVPLISETAAVSISPEAPEARIVLELAPTSGRMQLVDQAQQPVRGARVSTADGDLTEVGPGLFSLGGVRRGVRMRITAPGLVPVCKIAVSKREAEDFTVVLAEGRQVVLRFVSDNWIASLPGMFSWPGVDCRVGGDAFGARMMPPSDRGGVAFEVAHFPVADVRWLSIYHPEPGIPVEVVDGEAVIRLGR